MKRLLSVAAIAAFSVGFVACEKGGAGDAPAADTAAPAKEEAKADSGSAGSTGVAECDEYFKAFDSCDSLPEASKAAMKQSVEAMRKSLADAPAEAKKNMAAGCKQGTDALKAAGCK